MNHSEIVSFLWGNRYFYRYTPPRPLEEIEADIRAIETDIMRMLSEVTGGSAAHEPRRD